MKKTFIILCILIISYIHVKAQQESAFSQYMFNSLQINPAYAGSHDYISTTLFVRDQWINFPGQPKTATFSLDYRIPTEQMGLGLTVITDALGVSLTNEIGLNYSYFVQTGKRSRLSFGVKLGVVHSTENLTELVVWDQDEVFSENQSRWFPKFGGGLYFYSDNYYIGLSSPTLYVYDNHYNFSLDITRSSYYRRHLYFSGGSVLTLSEAFKIKPFALVKYLPNVPLQVDLNLAGVYHDKFWLGAGYRFNKSVMFMLALQLNDYLRFGYSFDFMNFELFQYTKGAHEIQLGIDFGGSSKRIQSIRYF